MLKLPLHLVLLRCSFLLFFLFLSNHQLQATDPVEITDTATQETEDSLPPSTIGDRFSPLDTTPDVQSFSKIASLFFIGDEGIRKILPAWPNDDFQKLPNSSVAINAHALTWDEIADLLNYTASKLGEASKLYTDEVKQHVTCKSSGYFYRTYIFQAKPESTSQVAQLKEFSTVQRCVNIRQVHYWLYCALRKIEQALRAGKLLDKAWWENDELWDKNDPITSYCKANKLWPLLDSNHNHINELLEKSTEIGLDLFSQDNSVTDEKQCPESTLYRLPTQEELFLAGLTDSLWNTSRIEPSPTEIQFAIDTSLIKQETDFDDLFPSERLEKEVPFSTNQDQQALFNKDRVFKDDLKIAADVMELVALGVSTGFLGVLTGFFARLRIFLWDRLVGNSAYAIVSMTWSELFFG